MIKNKVIKNISWIIVCKVIQAILALVVSMITARYLGPAKYGTINYASSLVMFVTPIMQLGINSIIVQELIINSDQEGEILGSSVLLNFISSIFCIFVIGVFVTLFNSGESETIIVCLLYSIILIFQSVELFQYWFQAKLLSKYTSVTMLCSYLVVSVYKIVLLICKKSVYWFAIVNVIDAMINATVFYVLYRKLGGQKLSLSKEMIKKLLYKGRYFIVSSMMITIFSQTDRIMIKLMINETATGYYSAAVTCALLSNFIFTAILDSARPSILESRKSNYKKYEEKMIVLFSVIILLAMLQCFTITLFSKWIINILYGEAYAISSSILKTVIWYTAFSYIGAVRSIWILAENQQRYLWIINLTGAVLNIVLNIVLIKFWGINGAAIASLITQFITNILVIQIIEPLRHSNYLVLKSLKFDLLLATGKEFMVNRKGNKSV